MRSLLVADTAFSGRKKQCVHRGGHRAHVPLRVRGWERCWWGDVGLGEDLGQGWGVSAIPHSIPCAWELPKAEQRELNPIKAPPRPVNQAKPIPKEPVGISAQQELKPKLAGASH